MSVTSALTAEYSMFGDEHGSEQGYALARQRQVSFNRHAHILFHAYLQDFMHEHVPMHAHHIEVTKVNLGDGWGRK